MLNVLGKISANDILKCLSEEKYNQFVVYWISPESGKDWFIALDLTAAAGTTVVHFATTSINFVRHKESIASLRKVFVGSPLSDAGHYGSLTEV